MATGKFLRANTSKKSQKISTSSSLSKSQSTGTVLGHMTMDITILRLSDGSLTMRTGIPTYTENLLKHRPELISSLDSLTRSETQRVSILLWQVMIAGLKNPLSEMTLSRQQ